MARNKKNKNKNTRDRDLDKKMKALSEAVAKRVSVFYKGWFSAADRSSLRKVRP